MMNGQTFAGGRYAPLAHDHVVSKSRLYVWIEPPSPRQAISCKEIERQKGFFYPAILIISQSLSHFN